MQIFLQYYYSAILNIELHCSKYCKKIIIFYLTLSPLFCLSSLTLSPLSLISRPCLSSLTFSPLSLISRTYLSSLSLHRRRTQQPQPNTISRHPQQPLATQHHITLISRLCLSSLSLHRWTQHLQPSTISHHPQQPLATQHHRAQPTNSWPTNLRSTTHDSTRQNQLSKTNMVKPTRRSTTHNPQSEQCKYELIMERMKFWVLLKPSCEI